jgi:hypothetical protein
MQSSPTPHTGSTVVTLGSSLIVSACAVKKFPGKSLPFKRNTHVQKRVGDIHASRSRLIDMVFFSLHRPKRCSMLERRFLDSASLFLVPRRLPGFRTRSLFHTKRCIRNEPGKVPVQTAFIRVPRKIFDSVGDGIEHKQRRGVVAYCSWW